QASQVATLATGRLPSQIRSADLNGDGRHDLVVANLLSGTLQVMLAAADGSFVDSPQQLPTGVGPTDFELLDFDGNGTIDLATINQLSGDSTLFLNAGDAQFSLLGSYRAGSGPYALGLNGSDVFFGDNG